MSIQERGDWTEGAIDKRFIRKIAKHANIREDIVLRILVAFRDVAAEEIVNTGKFYFQNFFRVSASTRKGNKMVDKKTGEVKGVIPDHQFLTVRLSKKLRKLFQMLDRPKESDMGVKVTKENWLQVYDQRFEPVRGKSREKVSETIPEEQKLTIDDILGNDEDWEGAE